MQTAQLDDSVEGEVDHGHSEEDTEQDVNQCFHFLCVLLLFSFSTTKIQHFFETTKFFCIFFSTFFSLSQTAAAKKYIYISPCPPCSSGSKKKGLGGVELQSRVTGSHTPLYLPVCFVPHSPIVGHFCFSDCVVQTSGFHAGFMLLLPHLSVDFRLVQLFLEFCPEDLTRHPLVSLELLGMVTGIVAVPIFFKLVPPSYPGLHKFETCCHTSVDFRFQWISEYLTTRRRTSLVSGPLQ